MLENYCRHWHSWGVNKLFVSIYLTTRNRAAMLKRAIDACLKQTHADFELIIVDDGSTDHTAAVISDFESADRRVKSIRFSDCEGACAARNAALNQARGEWVTGLDDDDFFLPHRLADFVRFDPQAYSFICSNRLELNEYGSFPGRKTRTIISFEDIKRRNYVGNQVFVKKERILQFLWLG